MPGNRAVRLHRYGGPEGSQVDSIDTRAPGPGQVFVQVKAAGVNALDYGVNAFDDKVRQGFVRDAFSLELPATLGIELAGVVIETGTGVAGRSPLWASR
mgnify:CR=1 FL=1